MPYVSPIIGYWDKLGYSWCVGCADPEAGEFDVEIDVEIAADNSAAQGVECDGCGTVLPFDPKARVQVSS